jgi:4-diphosphocytidyl-2-C-methyl-D-erythritol kinase
VTRLRAHAKLTLSLRVLGARPDGYHDLDALVVSLTEPHDVVEVDAARAASVHVGGRFAAGVPADASNLAARAARLAGRPAAIGLDKGIPPQAGLGGGSADAAAVLVALVGAARAEGLGAQLGADVPFCVRGGAARVRGRGEQVVPVALAPLHVVVAVPRFGCATADVYRAWDALGGPAGRAVDVDGLPPLVNDLEPAAEHVEPRLSGFRRAVEDAAGAPAILAGSGAAYAVVRASPLGDVAARVAAAVDGAVFEGVTADAGVVVVDP